MILLWGICLITVFPSSSGQSLLYRFFLLWGNAQHAAVNSRQAVRLVQSCSLTRLHGGWNGLPEIPGGNQRASKGKLGLPGCRWWQWHRCQCSSHTRRWCQAPYPGRKTGFCWVCLATHGQFSHPKGAASVLQGSLPKKYISAWEITLRDVWTWAKSTPFSSGHRGS